MNVVPVVLAAGAGRRMGGPKAMLRPRPALPTLLESAVAHLRDTVGEGALVVVVVGAAAEETGALARALGTEVVVADDWEEGIGASLRAGLRHLGTHQPPADQVIVTLVDLPDVGADVYRRVVDAVAPLGRAARARATYDGRPGHPVVLGHDHWAAVVESARGDRGARSHLDAAPTHPVECGDLATGRDIDTPDDLVAVLDLDAGGAGS